MYLYILIIALVYVSPLPATDSPLKSIPAPLVIGIQTALNKIATDKPQGLLNLDDYNHQTEYYEKINSGAIKEFLNQELSKQCIDPNTVTYFIGTQGQDWQFIRLHTGYGLVIPEATAQLGNLVQRLLGYTTEFKPEYELNILGLNKIATALKSSQVPTHLGRYKLAIAKAIVNASSNEQTNSLISACSQGAIAHAVAFSPAISQGLSNALSALSYVYNIIPEHNKNIIFQKNLDEYILSLLDLDLMQAHLEDLKQQLEAFQGSYAATLLSYLPIEKNNLKERIQIINDYYQELKMLRTLKKK